ncbi:MAG: pyruvate, phosphate dikinase [Gemmatimonadota bacterium]
MSAGYVYYFGGGEADGGKEDKQLLGGKGANLAEMTRIGVPVPPGFTLSTDVCREYMRHERLPEGLDAEVARSLSRLEKEKGKGFGDPDRPLLLSVRSGAAISMPGMMDTILNLGLNEETVEGLAREAEDRRFAFDSYRRFVQMYGDVVLRIEHADFEKILSGKKSETGARYDMDLDADALEDVVKQYKKLVLDETGQPFPDDPQAQLWGAIEAVFASWNNQRARDYRRVHRIDQNLGTGVNVMAMVYGNMGENSATGVAFTRHPGTGENRFFGEFLINAQGEDVVAGIRDPLPIDELKEQLPEAYKELMEVQQKLENHYTDMQDLEFTVERGRLFLLQTRRGKRTMAAAVKIAVDMVDEGLIDERTAVLRIDPMQLDQLLHPRLDPKAEVEMLAKGLPASPGAASGQVVFQAEEAERRAADGVDVILVREETSPDDFSGMVAARGILTSRGGMTSHAAVVARGMGKPCVVGASDLDVDLVGKTFQVGDLTVNEGDWLTIDGTGGRVLQGKVPTVEPEMSDEFRRLMEWADARRRLKVRTNADTPNDASKAREFGAEGIGLCRTEHMFFEGERIWPVREMILAEDEAARRRALEKLRPIQREDFEGIFRAMDGYPVTIRLLDPPLHEFLPRGEEEIHNLAERLDVDLDHVRASLEKHRESNPMLGHRGVRLGMSHPEITEMQARAMFQAAVNVSKAGVKVRPEVMVPLVADVAELKRQEKLIRTTAQKVFEESGVEIPFLVGTMIELPRACLTAGDIAGVAEFFSFGTNDLTQTTFGISRDDAGTFLPLYVTDQILADDPFQVLDEPGVGRLVKLATQEGRAARPDLKVGICGEHGGEPQSVTFFHKAGLDYVSCSPFRVPVARLAAAHAALAEEPEPAQTRHEAERVPVEA